MSRISQFKIITIDGGAAAGKSSTSRAIAERLNLMHVDTGAHYRTITCALLQQGADVATTETIPGLLTSLNLSTEIEDRSAYICVNGRRFDDSEIRSPEVNAQVSQFAAVQAVRDFLLSLIHI